MYTVDVQLTLDQCRAVRIKPAEGRIEALSNTEGITANLGGIKGYNTIVDGLYDGTYVDTIFLELLSCVSIFFIARFEFVLYCVMCCIVLHCMMHRRIIYSVVQSSFILHDIDMEHTGNGHRAISFSSLSTSLLITLLQLLHLLPILCVYVVSISVEI